MWTIIPNPENPEGWQGRFRETGKSLLKKTPCAVSIYPDCNFRGYVLLRSSCLS